MTFYSKLFNAEPAKRRPGYANFAIAEPPLKLVLLENPGQGGTHQPPRRGGREHRRGRRCHPRFMAEGLETRIEDGTTCCYALQDKVWVTGPGGEPWEVYTVLADAGAELEGKALADVEGTPTALGPAADAAVRRKATARRPSAASAAPADPLNQRPRPQVVGAATRSR